MVFKLSAYRKAWFPVESVTNYSEIGPPGAKLPCHHILEGKQHCPQSPDPRGLTCSLSDCVTYTNNNFFEPRNPQGLRKRVGCTYWIKYNKLEFIDVFSLTCLKLVLLSSQNWDTLHKNLHSQLPLKIAPSDITELASPIATISCSCRSSCPFSQSLAPILQTPPPPLPTVPGWPPRCHQPDYLPDQLTLKAFRCSPWSFCKTSFTFTV